MKHNLEEPCSSPLASAHCMGFRGCLGPLPAAGEQPGLKARPLLLLQRRMAASAPLSVALSTKNASPRSAERGPGLLRGTGSWKASHTRSPSPPSAARGCGRSTLTSPRRSSFQDNELVLYHPLVSRSEHCYQLLDLHAFGGCLSTAVVTASRATCVPTAATPRRCHVLLVGPWWALAASLPPSLMRRSRRIYMSCPDVRSLFLREALVSSGGKYFKPQIWKCSLLFFFF